MAKSKKTKHASTAHHQNKEPLNEPLHSNISELLSSCTQLKYKVLVLLYDLRNLSKDINSEKRTLETTDELYISQPYFTESEAKSIKSAIVSPKMDETKSVENIEIRPGSSVEEAIKSNLSNFLGKRKASGDSRPCGPHDMAPIYQHVFDIQLEEIENEKFLARLRRNGVK